MSKAIKNNTVQGSRLKEMIEILTKNGILKGLNPIRLRQIIEDLGPTYVKLGQIMSMRSDIIPSEYCDELMKLRTDVFPMPYSDVIEQIENSLGGSFDDFFSEIKTEPIGSASIAQVHACTLLDGTHGVVKVQRKGVYETMSRDIVLLRRAAKILKISGTTSNVLDFNIILNELWETTKEELDFLVEAKQIEKFALLNKDVKYVRTPKVYKQCSTSKVLVLEFIHGIQINDVDNLKNAGYDIQEIGKKLAASYAKQIIEDGYFHADPHPGNLIISGGKIVWIDFGMMGKLSKRNKQLFLEGIQCIVTNDIAKLKDIVLTIGKTKDDINHPALYADIDILISKYALTDLSELQMGDVINDIMDTAKKHTVSLPAGLSMIGRGITTLEGVLRELDADISFIDILANHLKPTINKDFIEEKTNEFAKGTYQSYESLLGVPPLLKDVLKMGIKGQTKIGIDLSMTSEFKKSTTTWVNNLVLGLIISGLLVGSSVITTTDMVPQILNIPLLGFIGFITAFILSIKIFYSIFKNR